MKTTLIRGGTVVLGQSVSQQDLLIKGEIYDGKKTDDGSLQVRKLRQRSGNDSDL